MSVGRGIMLAAGAILGAVMIYFAIQELRESPSVEESAGTGPERGRLRSVTIRMRDNEFRPENVSIRAGQTVQWINDDDTAHTVTNRSGEGPPFDSGRIAPDDLYERTFVDRGIFRYVCTIHPGMRGKVTVLGD